MTVTDFLQKVHGLGLGLAQIGDNIPLFKFDDDKLRFIKNYADARNIEIELGMRGLRKELLTRYITIAEIFQTTLLRIVIDSYDFEPTKSDVIDLLTAFTPELKRKGIRLAIENHDRFSCQIFKEIIDETDRDVVGICLDSVNSYGQGEGIREVAGLLLPYTINIHLKDYSIVREEHQMGFKIAGVPAGEGQLPIKWLVDESRKYNKCDSVILELWPAPLDSIKRTIEREEEWVLKSLSNLKILNIFDL